MIFFTLLNMAIIFLVAFAIYFTNNPLCILALMFLVSIPIIDESHEEDDDDSQPMGFNADVK